MISTRETTNILESKLICNMYKAKNLQVNNS